MNFMEPFNLVVSTLSPLHIGCGEDFIPTEYVVDANGRLHPFDPAILAAPGNASILEDISKALTGDDAEKQLREIHRVLQHHCKRIIPDAAATIPMCGGVHGHYKGTQKSDSDFNRNGIERTSFSPLDQRPYIPGSSLKGAIRTAILNTRNTGDAACSEQLQQQIRAFNSMIEEYSAGGEKLMLRLKKQYSKHDYESTRRDVEKAIASEASQLGSKVLGGSFETDPMRALKIGDALPLDEGIEREIRFCLNRSRSGHKTQAQAKNLYTRLEYILEHQPEAFGLPVTLQNLRSVAGRRSQRNTLLAPLAENQLNWPEIVKACNEYYKKRLLSDLATVRKLFPDSSWAKATRVTLDAGLFSQIEAGNCLLLRVGKHGGADSNTVDGRQIKIMLSEDKRLGRDGREEKIRLYVFDSQPRTTWYCGDHLDRPADLLPHGWVVLSGHDQPWHRSLPGYERKQIRLQAAAETARLKAEAEAAAKAEADAQAARETARAQMSQNLRSVEDLIELFRVHHQKYPAIKQNPNADFHNRARALAKAAYEGSDWTPEEKAAAADAIEEWLPKVVRVEMKDERKKLKLAALRGQMQRC